MPKGSCPKRITKLRLCRKSFSTIVVSVQSSWTMDGTVPTKPSSYPTSWRPCHLWPEGIWLFYFADITEPAGSSNLISVLPCLKPTLPSVLSDTAYKSGTSVPLWDYCSTSSKLQSVAHHFGFFVSGHIWSYHINKHDRLLLGGTAP